MERSLSLTKLSASPELGGSHIWLLGVARRKGAQSLAPPQPAGLPGVRGKARQQTAPLSLAFSFPWSHGAQAERQRGEAGLAGWVIASYRQVDDCHRRLPEDMETEPLLRPAAPGAGCQLSAQGSRFPSPSH